MIFFTYILFVRKQRTQTKTAGSTFSVFYTTFLVDFFYALWSEVNCLSLISIKAAVERKFVIREHALCEFISFRFILLSSFPSF